jgi:hypothetical protein
MPHEIADSDAESDFNSPGRQLLLHDVPLGHGVTAASSQINFDEYMDPTQRLSFPSSNIESAERTTASTIGLFDGISDAHDALNGRPAHGQMLDSANPSPVIQSRKRANSAMHESSNTPDYDALVQNSKAKRTKTYGHRSKSGGAEHNDLFAASPELLLDSGNKELADQSSDHPRPISLLDQPMQSSLQNITTSTASMGGYASINLDYRGSGEALDVNSNPFGSLSQVSLDEDPNPVETERVASMFRYNPKASGHGQAVQDSLSTIHKHSLPLSISSQPSLEQPLSVNPSRLTYNHIDPSEVYLNEQEGDSLVSADSMPAPDRTPMAEDIAPAKKRGRKPKNSRMFSKSPTPAVPDETVDEQDLPDLELLRKSRQGTVDSVSAASHASSTDKRRKRGKSGRVAHTGVTPTDQSPAKHPTSELNLSDEQLIGLPKESYKPRPSRSRSKKLTNEHEVFSPSKIADPTMETPAKNKPLSNDASPFNQEADPTAEKSSTKKTGRKARVKRAKTSGVALRVAEPMLSEGEDDVVWMDSKPAPVKLELPPDLKVLKEEDGQNYVAEDMWEAERGLVKGKNSNITIEIPLAADGPHTTSPSKAPSAANAPKKRGRKPKKAQQEQQADLKATGVKEIEGDTAPGEVARHPLAQKSSNIPPSKARSTTPKAPAFSPLSSPELEPQTMASSTKEQSAPLPLAPEPTNLTTPTKPTIEKGPTKHSPINPPSLPGSAHSNGKRALYRIGLSRRQNIPSLLRRVQRDKPPPKIVVVKEKEKKKKNAGDNGSDDDIDDRHEMRGADGMLVEWGD